MEDAARGCGTTLGDKEEHRPMGEQEPSEEEVVQAAYAFAAEQLKNGSSVQQIQAMLVENGLDPEIVGAVVSDVTRIRSEVTHEAGRKNMLYGALWLMVGIGVTVSSYRAASHGAGYYVVAWGAILVGAIRFVRGLVQASER